MLVACAHSGAGGLGVGGRGWGVPPKKMGKFRVYKAWLRNSRVQY